MQTYDVVELAQKLIRYPSVTPEADDIIQYLVQLLTPLGFKCQVMDFQSEGRPKVANLFARYGTAGPHICYAGHVDVVPIGNAQGWTHPPFAGEVHNGTLYGRGAADMKGSIAAFIAAFAAVSVQGSVSLLITGDEEGDAVDGTVRMLHELQKQEQIPSYCLVGEPTSDQWLGDTIKVGRRGSLSGHILVRGKQGHVAYPHRADNPVRRLVHFLNELQSHVWDKGNEFFDPSNLEVISLNADNVASNVIPQDAEARFNIRYNNEHTAAEVTAQIEAIAMAHCKDFKLNFKHGAEPFINQAAHWADLVVSSVESVCGKKPHLSTTGGTSDARFIHHYCPVVELGLFIHTAHQLDECVPVEDLKTLQRIYQQVLTDSASLTKV
jgi:succinyl-diaminopimelate desuccinylase